MERLNRYGVFINFVLTSIYDPASCLQSTIRWARQLELEPSNLVFEVVESYKVSDLEHLKNVLDYYRTNGFLVALDNDELKRSVFKAIVTLSREANIQVLAEGVETVQEYEFIKDHVDFVQGFLFARPGPEPVREIEVRS